ncbi:MAG TPA: bifunctional phosphopantothenoylcysteine decarboxylase/phosphopantothenate--cysteine ligase CoaBC [candidate division Zixibacteria bacterium]|nr:bifunctional phosphopantothenoylcysteine decarboxylase/phosphopantothenate--cysteine ligase CoaBC [candidate division Zixibacteria bacterium]
MSIKGKNILLGVSGGIGAYKACELLRLFVKAEARVRVIMTEAAQEFVTPLTFQSLGAEEVSTSVFEPKLYSLEHVNWADWGNIMVIAPCTANVIGKMAGGIADEVLSTQAMAFSGPILLAPAMNVKMYNNKAVQKNIAYLKSIGVNFIGPEVGHLATLITATGRMSDPAVIFSKTRQILLGRNDLKGKRVVVGAGPTREPLDPVRYISNYSSGKMGYALAEAAIGFGADVTLISGPSNIPVPPGVNIIRVETASQMQSEIERFCIGADYLYMAAAVSDFKPASFQKQKIKRTEQGLKLVLHPNPDILKSLGKNRPQIVVGFALEIENLEARAFDKLRDKRLDMIVANNPSEEGVGFGSDYNRVTILTRQGKPVKLEKLPKFDVAIRIIEESIKLRKRDVPKNKR